MLPTYRLPIDNPVLQAAIRNQLMIRGNSNYSSGASEHMPSGAESILVVPSNDAETLSALLSPNTLLQQFASIRASLATDHNGLHTGSSTALCSDLTPFLSHVHCNRMNRTRTSEQQQYLRTRGIDYNSFRPFQLANVIDSSLVHAPYFARMTSDLDLGVPLNATEAKQPILNLMKRRMVQQHHNSRVLAKSRVASFAPIRKKSKHIECHASAKLENVNFDYDSHAELTVKPSKNFTKWQAMLETLKKFKETHGHCIVPRGFEDMKLASWVVEQRKQFRRYQENLPCGIDSKRINCLNEIGFTWDAQEAAWDRQMDHLREFHRIHGHCDVSRDDVQFPKLYLWMREQRRHYKLMKQGQASLLTKARIDALKSVCFSFDTLGAIFTSQLQDLAEFRRRHGHCHVPPGYCTKANCKLFGWTQRLKKEYKAKMRGQKSTLSEAHIKALNELEFPWLSGKPEENGPVARRSRDDASTLSSSDDNALASDSSEYDVGKAYSRPLKKRRI